MKRFILIIMALITVSCGPAPSEIELGDAPDFKYLHPEDWHWDPDSSGLTVPDSL